MKTAMESRSGDYTVEITNVDIYEFKDLDFPEAECNEEVSDRLLALVRMSKCDEGRRLARVFKDGYLFDEVYF